MYKDFLSCKILLGFLALLSLFCIAEDDILRNHKNLTPSEIVKRIEPIITKPPNFRTREDLVKQQQYLDLYKKNLEILYPLESNPIKWAYYYYRQQLLLSMQNKYIESRNLALWYAKALKKAPDLFSAFNFLITVYLDLSYCNAVLGNKSAMLQNLQTAKKIFTESLHDSLTIQYPPRSMESLIQSFIYEQEIQIYAVFKDRDHVFTVISDFIKIYGNEENFEKKSYSSGFTYFHLSVCYQHQKNFPKAEYYAKKSNEGSIKNKCLYISNCIFLARRYYEQKQYRDSLNVCNMVFQLPKDFYFTPSDFDWRERVKLLLTAAKCYAALGQKEKCLEYLNLAEAKSKDPAIHKQIQSIRDKMKNEERK